MSRSVIVAARLTPDHAAVLEQAISAMSATLPPGGRISAGSYVEALILADLRARGLLDGPAAPAPVAPQKAPAAPKVPAPPSRLRAAREAAGLSQNALAKVAGCDPSLVSQVERGKVALGGDLLRWVEGATVAP